MSPAARRLTRARWPLAVLAGTLLFTRLLTAPGVQPADAGEFQLVARELGIAHPPGYALYTLAAHAWGRAATVPVVGRALGADPALWTTARPADADPWTWAINAFSALLAVLTLALVYRAGSLLSGARLGGLAAALALALVPTFLIQSAIANIRMPTALLTALLIYLACRWLADEAARPPMSAPPSPDWRLAGLALVAGLALGHHGSLALIALVVAIVALARRPRLAQDWRTMAAVLGALGLSALPQLYLPVRDFQGALFAAGHLRTLAGVINHVSAADFRGDTVPLGDLDTLLDRVGALANVFMVQMGPLLLGLGLVGLWWLARRDRWAAALLGPIVLLTALASLIYKAPQTVEYLMPSYVAIALMIGAAIAGMSRARLAARLLAALVLLGLPATLWLIWQASAAGARSWRADWLGRVFDPALSPPETVVLAAWHYAMPLLYAQRYWSGRPDMTVQYVYPEGAETPGETWLKRLRATPGQVLITNRPRELQPAGIVPWPVPGTPLYATGEGGTDDALLGGSDLDPPALFGDRVRLDHAGVVEAQDGREVSARLRLEALRPITETLTVTAQLIDPATGAVWGQTDHGIPPDRWAEGRLVEELIVVPFRGPRPAWLRTDVGLYRRGPGGPERLPTDGGEALTIEAAAGSLVREPLSLPAPAAGQVPFGDAMTLVASSLHREGAQLVVDLTWRADRSAARSDYTVSVQAHGEGWSAQDDGTPALGAIPTLKWLPGMVIHDRHRVQLPADLPADAPFRLTVGVYDAFSLEPLPVTDAERVRRGEGQMAEIFRQGG